MNDYYIRDDGDIRKYYIQVPNMVDDLALSVYAFRLYVHLKRVAGEEGACYQSTRTLADSCRMSTASVSRAKQELLGHKLIEVDDRKTEHGGRDYHYITITDIWQKNISSYSGKQVSTSNLQGSNGNLQVSPQKLASYSGAIKEEPIKKNPLRIVTADPDKILSDASGLATFPADQREWIEVVRSLVETHGESETTQAMKQAYTEWVNTKGKNGRTYKRTNLNWINWAQEILLGGDITAPAKDPKNMTDEEWFAWKQAQAQQQEQHSNSQSAEALKKLARGMTHS